MVESSDKTWSTGEENGKLLQYSCLENPMNSMKRQKDRTPKDELLKSVGAQYATGDQWRNNSRKNEEMEPKQKQHIPHFKAKFACYSRCFLTSYFCIPVPYNESSVQFSSVSQLCPTLCNPMNRSTPGFPVHHHLPEFTQTHVHRVRDAIEPSHPRSSPSPPAPNLSQHQSLFQ